MALRNRGIRRRLLAISEERHYDDYPSSMVAQTLGIYKHLVGGEGKEEEK